MTKYRKYKIDKAKLYKVSSIKCLSCCRRTNFNCSFF